MRCPRCSQTVAVLNALANSLRHSGARARDKIDALCVNFALSERARNLEVVARDSGFALTRAPE